MIVTDRPLRRVMLMAVMILVVTAIAVVGWWLTRDAAEPEIVIELEPVRVDDAEQLEQCFRQYDFSWPPQGPLPAIAVDTLPGDLNEQRVQRKKSLFFRTLAPLIAAENAYLRQQRSFLQDAFADQRQLADPDVRARIRKIAVNYKVAGESDDSRFQRKLLERVDVIPPGLVLAQAANESAWGTSRFAQEANNLFGMWTWNAERGLEPQRRDPDATHYVRLYENLREAVRGYLFTLNTGNAYAGLRRIRAELRAAGKPLDPLALAAGLSAYSERGDAYVDEIRSIIRYNKLDGLYQLEFRSGSEPVSP